MPDRAKFTAPDDAFRILPLEVECGLERLLEKFDIHLIKVGIRIRVVVDDFLEVPVSFDISWIWHVPVVVEGTCLQHSALVREFKGGVVVPGEDDVVVVSRQVLERTDRVPAG